MARPRKHVDTAEIVRLRQLKLSWNVIALRTGLGRGTVVRAYQATRTTLQPSQNPESAILETGHPRLWRPVRPRAPVQPKSNGLSVRLTGLEGASFRQR
jgi:hypothetical protein